MPSDQEQLAGQGVPPGQITGSRYPGVARPPPGPALPSISLPKGGGAIQSIGEKFATNPTTGTATLAVPIGTSPGRGGQRPDLALVYDSGSGNGPFGLGWTLPTPAISRKTSLGVPRYDDNVAESDTFVLGSEDLAPSLVKQADGTWRMDESERTRADGSTWTVRRYRPRIEGQFPRIERWTDQRTGQAHWRSISGDNRTIVYGQDSDSRICDPADPARRIFAWLASESYDDKGNALSYEYVAENGIGVPADRLEEAGRTDAARSAARYLKRIRYGNQSPHVPGENLRARTDWMFEVVLDYDDHDRAKPTPTPTRPWPVRADPFSTYRAGFELRTYRLCRRVLVFHHFPAEPETGADCLVHSLDFDYDEGPALSFLRRVHSTGWLRQADASYSTATLPPLELSYTHAIIGTTVRTLDPDSMANLPAGLDQSAYVWADLAGQALPGIFSVQADGCFYKANLGGGQFGPLQVLPTQPSAGDLLGPGRDIRGGHLTDLSGDGRLDLVSLGQPPRGFFARSDDGGWLPFHPFDTVPNIEWASPHAHLVDLTGDGRADLLLTEDDAFTWYQSLGEAGFGPPERLVRPGTEPGEPTLVFSDRQQAVFFADLSGDGMLDLVRVRNGEVCYWPSTGYGRFSGKVIMCDSPWLDAPDQFDADRLRMADVDGTGTADLLYLGADGVRVYFNRCGNSWSAGQHVLAFPPADELSAITVTDLLGQGTACLVWSSPLPDTTGRQIRYVDLMAAGKPHLLVSVTNNLGATTRIEYISSTSCYAADRAAGRPWATRLPFPVQCVAKAETVDAVAGHRFVNTYAYHHGCFDPVEREFRGFGCVDRYDTESFEQFALSRASNFIEQDRHQPPVLTRTWYHLGIAVDGAPLPRPYIAEYYHNDALPERPPMAPELPSGLSERAYRDAMYACKGLMLRHETYCPDGSALAAQPYVTADDAFEVRLVQPAGPNRHACFMIVPRESVTYYYERQPSDPRIAHTLVLDCDELGNVTKAASVGYPRQAPDGTLPSAVQAAQARAYVTYSEIGYTGDVDTAVPLAYRLRAPYSGRSYELTGATRAGRLFTTQELRDAVGTATRISFEQPAPGTGTTVRLLGAELTAYLADDLTGPLPFGKLAALGLTHQEFRLAFTDGLIAPLYGGLVTDAMLTVAGYVRPAGARDWWIPGSTQVFPADAAAHFYLPTGVRDPFGAVSEVDYDRYDLLAAGSRDALGNHTTATNDYRLLGPVMLTDPNLNQTVVAVDELGQVTAVAVMGKADAGEGDTLANPTQQLTYDLANWMNNRRPVYVHLIEREEFGAANTRFTESYVYTGGTGQVAMTKVKAEPGVARVWDPVTSTVKEVDTTPAPRWVGSGRTVLDNKGNVVKQYEPYFSATPGYEDQTELVAAGVTPVMRYDPLGRCIRTERPDGTFAKVEFGPWQDRRFDPNDTVLDSAWYAERGSPDPATQPEPADPEQRAAWLAAKDADTPSVTVTDGLGRAVYHIADNGPRGKYGSRMERDVSGTRIAAFDARGRTVAQSWGDLAGRSCHTTSPEKGDRWLLHRVTGEPVLAWDAIGRRVRTTYDELSRPVCVWLTEPPPPGQSSLPATPPEKLVGYQVYGERDPDAVANNRRGRPYLSYDQAGAMVVDAYDFRYAPTGAALQLIPESTPSVDWAALAGDATIPGIRAAAQNLLDPETFHTATTLDALGRPTLVTLADGTAIRTTYDDGGFVSTLSATIRGQGPAITFIRRQEHDARGRRSRLELGNGTTTTYSYDPATFRLTQTRTVRQSDSAVLQDLAYIYDPVADIVAFTDSAQQTLFFANTLVKPQWTFEYDALYQLIRATGRESAGLSAGRDWADTPVVPLPHPADTAAVRNYTENYSYDDLGNITTIQHIANGVGTGWTTKYRYTHDNDPADATNRLAATSLPSDPAGLFSVTYGYDQSGNMARTPHLPALGWNYLDQLVRADLGGGASAQYLYASGGGRVRKVVRGSGATRTVVLQLGTLEITRAYIGDTLMRERSTVFVSDASGRIARADSETVSIAPVPEPGGPVLRYEYGSHLDSVTLETDESGALVSYEEYHPFGTSAYRSGTAAAQTSLKRYRFLRRERDDETGFYQLGARYYAPWLGRWISPDPAGYVDGPNLYRYCSNNPVAFRDPSGTRHVDEKNIVPIGTSRAGSTEKAQEARLRKGKGTPEEALSWFQTHGHPELTQLPEWSKNLHRWIFPDKAGSGQHEGGGAGTTGGAAGQGGSTAVKRNPEGATVEVIEGLPEEKMSAIKERIITDRAIAPRSKPAGGGSRTADLRRATRGLKEAYEAGLPGGKRPPGTDVGHKVDLQLIGRHNDVVRPSEFAAEPLGPNRSQGPALRTLLDRQIAAGLPEDVPVGGVARTSQMGRLVNQPGFRTALRAGGYVLMAAGPALTAYGASQVDNRGVKYAGWGLAGTEAAGSLTYTIGRTALGGGKAGTAIGLQTMKVGGTVAGVAGGAAQALISGYLAYEDYQRGDMRSFWFDAAAAVGGIALIAAAIVTAPAWALGLTIFGIATGVAAGIYHLGKAFNWWK